MVMSILYNYLMRNVSECLYNSETKLGMVSGSFYIPKERDGRPEGEDAHFICKEEETIGVADGVGSWIEKGVDAGIYARNLMANCLATLQKYHIVGTNRKKFLKGKKTLDKGSSTACLLRLKNNVLFSANVGDSGFLIIRDGVVFYKSPIQIRGFNCPYQLGKTSDNADVTQVSKLKVQACDIVVLGTDGLFDNLYAKNIEEIINFSAKDGAEPECVAIAIAKHAYCKSIDKTGTTPYGDACSKNSREHYGDKKDDITVVVSFIKNR